MDGPRLRRLRVEKLKLSQTEFGIILGYRGKTINQTVSDLEREKGGRILPPHLHSLVIMLEEHGMESLRPFMVGKLAQLKAEPEPD